MAAISLNDNTKALKDILFDILAKKKIKRFEVNFSGEGDDGCVDGANLPTRILDKKVQVLEGHETIDTIVRMVCDEVLENSFSGWENDSGAHGTFIFDVSTRKVTLEFHERFIETNDSEWDIDPS